MSAAEVSFPNPPPDQPQQLALAQDVFTTLNQLKWQIYTFNAGCNLEDPVPKRCFFDLAARSRRYAYTQTYAQWADTIQDWSVDVALISGHYISHDRTDDRLNCAERDYAQWSYNAGVYLYAREALASRNIDQQIFKAYLSRRMAGALKIVPYTHDIIMPFWTASAHAAPRSCTGKMMVWLVERVARCLCGTVAVGGTSVANPNAGVESTVKYIQNADLTMAVRTDEWILTVMNADGKLSAGGKWPRSDDARRTAAPQLRR
ncbi:glycoside hydrolase family 76 protein [Dothistroma septosporum NZE10]|uniref:Glycoside hydrolase family 76 protein n=1 Tax=Dothistroma septosporum (strain NZE10 / CBS 128990) TaxID=675120 RepID=N1PJ91_DOTSN|nr:glycoside hydrolase family 76 protein [Dothistroma septosporum NZE10]